MKKSVKRFTRKQVYLRMLLPAVLIASISGIVFFQHALLMANGGFADYDGWISDNIYQILKKYDYDSPEDNKELKNELQYFVSAYSCEEEHASKYLAIFDRETFEPVVVPSNDLYLKYENKNKSLSVYIPDDSVRERLMELADEYPDSEFSADSAYIKENGTFIPVKIRISSEDGASEEIITDFSDIDIKNCELTEFDTPAIIVTSLMNCAGSYFSESLTGIKSDQPGGYSIKIRGYYPERVNMNPEYIDTGAIYTEKYEYIWAYGEKYNLKKMFNIPWLKRYIIIRCVILALFLTVLFSEIKYFGLKAHYRTEDFRKELTNTMAHDLKTPLMAASGYAENLAAGTNPEKNVHYAEAISENIRHMDSIITDVLELSKLESGESFLNRIPLQMNSITEEILRKNEMSISEKNLSVRINGTAEVNADEVLMKRLVENLITNAVKYSDAGSEITVTMTEKSFVTENQSDSVDESSVKELVKPFVRGDKSRKGKGSGLGLSIVKNICNLHGFDFKISVRDNRFKAEIRYR